MGGSIMPAYDFQCDECGTLIEVVRSIKDESKICCVHCEKEMKQVVISNTNVVFMGDGWARKPKPNE